MTFYKILSNTKVSVSQFCSSGYKTHVHHQHVRFHRDKKFKRSIVEIHSVYKAGRGLMRSRNLGTEGLLNKGGIARIAHTRTP